jgi:hypothetical protein
MKNRRLFSPEIFSAGFKVLLCRRTGRSSTFGQLVVKSRGNAMDPSRDKMPWRGGAGQSQSRGGIYLVDNKDGGKNRAELMYTVPNLIYRGVSFIYS